MAIVFNPVDTPSEKEVAEVAKIWSDVDSNYISAGVMSAEEVRDVRRSQDDSPYSALADDIEGEVSEEVEQAADEALDFIDEPEGFITTANGNVVPIEYLDVTDVSEKFKGLQEYTREEVIDKLNFELNKLIDEKYDTGTPPLQIRIDKGKVPHIVDNGKSLRPTQQKQKGAALLTLKEIISKAKKTERDGTVDLNHNKGRNKQRKEDTVEKYVYFEAFVKIKAKNKDTGKYEVRVHPVELATEQIKGQDANLLDLYNIHVKKGRAANSN